MTWNIGQFHRLARTRLPGAAAEALNRPLASIPWKFALSRYHASCVTDILTETFEMNGRPAIHEAIGKVLLQAAGTDEGNRFANCSFRAEAHLIAFAQALHSTGDIFAQVLCIGLDLDRLFKPHQPRYLSTTISKLRAERLYPSISEAASDFRESDEYHYLSAYVNITKHQSFVPSGYSIALLPGDERHGLKIGEFSRGAKRYPSKWAADFAGQDLEKLSQLFGALGEELTACLAGGSAHSA